MRFQDLYATLILSGFPVAYQSFGQSSDEPISLPCVVYFATGNDDLNADNEQYVEIINTMVELYTGSRSISDEKVLEQIFKANGIVFGKTVSYVEKEKMFQISYEFQTLGG